MTNFLKNLYPSDILLDENFERIKNEVDEIIYSFEMSEAAEYSRDLFTVLEQVQAADSLQQKRLKILWKFFYKIRLFSFPDLEVQEQLQILKEEILNYLALGLDVKAAIYDFLDLLSDPGYYTAFTKGYLNALISSKSKLGIKLAGTGFGGTVAEWLQEFVSTARGKGIVNLQNLGAFDVVNFLNANKYANMLSAREKQILASLLELYEWLENPIFYSDEKPALLSGNVSNAGQAQHFSVEQKFVKPSDFQAGKFDYAKIIREIPTAKQTPANFANQEMSTETETQDLIQKKKNIQGDIDKKLKDLEEKAKKSSK